MNYYKIRPPWFSYCYSYSPKSKSKVRSSSQQQSSWRSTSQQSSSFNSLGYSVATGMKILILVRDMKLHMKRGSTWRMPPILAALWRFCLNSIIGKCLSNWKCLILIITRRQDDDNCFNPRLVLTHRCDHCWTRWSTSRWWGRRYKTYIPSIKHDIQMRIAVLVLV